MRVPVGVFGWKEREMEKELQKPKSCKVVGLTRYSKLKEGVMMCFGWKEKGDGNCRERKF